MSDKSKHKSEELQESFTSIVEGFKEEFDFLILMGSIKGDPVYKFQIHGKKGTLKDAFFKAIGIVENSVDRTTND